MSLFGPTLARRNAPDARYLASLRRDAPRLRARIRDADRDGRTCDALDHRRELVRMFALAALPPDASGLRLVDQRSVIGLSAPRSADRGGGSGGSG